jgi:XRE family aerobic/anaerobic benzoate catabolism transcriptional regulator
MMRIWYNIMDNEHLTLADEIPDIENREFLAELGQRVRNVRTLRGMSRKILAQVSGISERYLAQLESGSGNFSIMLLRRVAQATGTPVEDLVADTSPSEDWQVIRDLLRDAPPKAVRRVKTFLNSSETLPSPIPAAVMVNRIVLIGMRGAGKATLGRIVAEQLGWQFKDLSRETELVAGLPLEEIYRLYGHEGYRRFEEKALKAIIATTGPLIVAASDGIVGDPAAFDLLLTSFFSVWIRATADEHMKRIREKDDCPAEDKEGAASELSAVLAIREPLYARARIALDTSNVEVTTSVDQLVDLIQHYCERNCPWAIPFDQ